MTYTENSSNKIEAIPANLLIYLYITPIISAFIIFFGIQYQTIHPLYLWVCLITISFILIFLPFLKKKKAFVRHLFLGLSLFSMILLISPAIEIPLLFVIPVLPALNIFLTLTMAYFAYFFMVFLTDIKVLDFFNILNRDIRYTRDEKIAKLKKWKKMFVISLLSVIAIFMITGIMMISKTKFTLKKIEQPEEIRAYMKEFIEKIGKEKISPETPVKTLSLGGENFIVPANALTEESGNRIIIYQLINNVKELTCSFEHRPQYPYLEIFAKQIISARYTAFAKNSENLIKVKYILFKKLNTILIDINTNKYSEIIILNKKTKIFINYFNYKKSNKLINNLMLKLNFNNLLNNNY